MYRLALRLSLLGLALALTALSVAPILVTPVLFYFCGLWLFWIACTCSATPWPGAARLSALWALIDFGLLALFLAMARNGPGGADIVVFGAFLPVTVPLVFLLSRWGGNLPNVGHLLEGVIGHLRADLVNAWFVMSLIAAIQSSVFVLVTRAIRSKRKGRASNPRLERP